MAASTFPSSDLVIRVAREADVGALAELRALWIVATPPEPDFVEQMAGWLRAEGERRTTWLALVVDRPGGMASLFEYRRMPKPGRDDSRWGYVSNMYVREDSRNRGVGSALLRCR
jgi:GNAT superfamily N-acetyltransferase